MKEKPTIKELQSFYDAYNEKALILDKIGAIKGIDDLLDVLNAIKGHSISTDTDQPSSKAKADSLFSGRPIKEFPQKADDDERNTLNKLAFLYLIERELSPQNKYKVIRNHNKNVVKELLKLGYNQNNGFIFMNQFIEYHVDPPTIQNYFRECKKDIPTKKPQNV